ncbi:MAG: cysteine hydrolase, partial [Mycoplasmoidaceae bacterium]|nr:cysteine hydrolase [Mycoplasmoidaceae bacterium]
DGYKRPIQVCGLLTNMCVLANTVLAKTVQPNADIFINKKCVSSNNSNLEKAAFKILKNLHIRII